MSSNKNPEARRRFLTTSAAAFAGSLVPLHAWGLGDASRFTFVRLIYNGDWNPRSTAARRLLVEVSKATSVEVRHEPIDLRPEDKRIFSTPFIWWTGTGDFPPLSKAARTNLSRFLRFSLLLQRLCQTKHRPTVPGIGIQVCPVYLNCLTGATCLYQRVS